MTPDREETVFLSPASPKRIGRGTQLSDIYEVDSLIGVGGMGEVYKGHNIETGEEVAIKTILPALARDDSALALFRKEAAALRHLHHESIVGYHVFAVDRALGLPYLAMEYVTGDALREVAARGPLAFDDVLVLQRRLASGLAAAHRLGIVHRDVTPDNIILPDGNVARAKIIDFGIARSPLGGETVIGSGFAGKLRYVSPEHLGLFGGEVAPASDIYSLGLVLAEAALGKPLDMGGSQVDLIDKRKRLPDLSGVDPRLRPLLEGMLQPRPADRPAGMAAVASWAPPERTAFRIARPAGQPRSRAPILVGGLAALLVAIGAGAVLIPRLRDTPVPTQQPSPARDPADRGPASLAAAPSPVPVPAPPSTDTGARLVPETQGLPGPPSPPPPEPQPPPERAERGPATPERMAAYLHGLSGDGCVFLKPVSLAPEEAVIEGFGATTAPFERLDAEFGRRFGFDPAIQLRLIAQPQCPIVDMMTRWSGPDGSRGATLTLRSDVVGSGHDIVGSADPAGEPNMEVLLVSEDGTVRSMTAPHRPGAAASFSERVRSPAGSREARPQLVVAVTSSKPLKSLRPSRPLPAARFAREVEEEAGRVSAAVTVRARYVKVGP